MNTITFDDLKIIKDRVQLPQLLEKLGAETIVEIGVWQGDHFEILIRANTVKNAYAVDAWRQTSNKGQNHGLPSQIELDKIHQEMIDWSKEDQRIHIIRDFSPAAAAQFSDNFFDFIYIDADHSEAGVWADLNGWFPKLKKGGIFSGHDYSPLLGGHFGVIPAVDKFIKQYNLQLYVDNSTSWYTIK